MNIRDHEHQWRRTARAEEHIAEGGERPLLELGDGETGGELGRGGDPEEVSEERHLLLSREVELVEPVGDPLLELGGGRDFR